MSSSGWRPPDEQLDAADHEIAPLVAEAIDIADRTGAALIRREAAHYGLTA